MSEILQCKQCAGTDFKKLGQNQYKCKYCGVITILEPVFQSKNTTDNTTKYNIEKNKKLYLISFALFLLFTAGVFFTTFISRNRNRTKGKFRTEATVVTKKQSTSSKAELKVLQHKIIKSSKHYLALIALLKNISSVKAAVRVEIHFYKNNKKILVKSSYGFRHYINPGETTPLKVYFSAKTKYDRYKLVIDNAAASIYIKDRPKLKISKLKFSKAKYNKTSISGRLKNLENRQLKLISLHIALLNKKGELYYIGTGYLQQKYVEQQEDVPFHFSFYNIKKLPAKYVLDYNAYFQK